MKKIILALAAAALAAALLAAPAQAAFGLNGFDVTFTDQDEAPATQAGSHPFAITTSFGLNVKETGPSNFAVDGEARDLVFEQVLGFVGDATAVPRCSAADFGDFVLDVSSETDSICPRDTAVGVVSVAFENSSFWVQNSVFNLTPPPGAVTRLGFRVLGTPVIIDVTVKPDGDHNIVATSRNTPQTVRTYGAALQLWGVPADPAHDAMRGSICAGKTINGGFPGFFGNGGTCSIDAVERPFLTLPRSCTGPALSTYRATSWQGDFDEGSALTHDDAIPPNPQGFTGCGRLNFSPEVSARATADSAESSSGLDFSLSFEDKGLTSTTGLAQSDVKKAVVTLPEGMTVNPSIGEGLGACTPSDLDEETLTSDPGEGCPNSSKIGTVNVETPLVDQDIGGSVFLAQQDDPRTSTPGAENPFDSLIAFYIVLRNPDLGVLVKLPAKVEPDPVTGQLVTTVDDAPQLPFSRFDFHFREGQRAPLITPGTCGTHTVESEFYPWADPANLRTVLSSFQITSGVGGGPCPPGGIPPFKPGFEAGSLNNSAGAFSPFYMRLTRADGEQDMTKFSSVLPPGVLGSLAGVSQCSDFAIAAAKAKTGREELADPSCPANSAIGRTLAGAGVGSALTYVPGQLYFSGPYNGAPLSVVSVTPAVAGPFDAGTVVVRIALTLNPRTAEVEADGSRSDPIPHILKGIVLKVRDLRVYVDRPNFILNPTSCEESSTKAILFGSFLDVFSAADDLPVDLSARYQAADCASLGFKPRLGIKLIGGTKRGGHPALRGTFRPRPGQANLEHLVLRLPRSAFLDQAHIRTICTRVQFAAGEGNGAECPPGAIYGKARAWSPLLDEPLEGPVFLRSSDHNLPDFVAAFHGIVEVEAVARIDSVGGGIRATFAEVPDAPLTKVVVDMQGGKKGLIVNSTNLCKGKHRAKANMRGHNGRLHRSKAAVRATKCGKGRKAGSSKRARLAKSSAVG